MSWLLKLYCLPGRIATAWTFLFPKNLTQAVQSGRQRNSTFAHFVISTPVWFVVFVMAVSSLRSPHTEAPAATGDAVAAAALGGAKPPAQNVVAVVNGGGRDQASDSLQEAAASTPIIPAQAPQATPVVELSPENTPEIAAAVEKAFASGQPERWSANGKKGYAVPSAVEPTSGCRSISYSIDSSGFQSVPAKVCS